MIEAIKTIKLWQIGVLVGIFVVGIGATYAAYTIVTRSEQPDLGEDQQLIPVTRGDLVNQVSVNGGLVFPNRDSLNFGTQGTVAEVLVEEGQGVVEGQALARLDAETLASLEKAIAQAEVNLRDGTEGLAAAKDPYTPLDLAEAEAKAANARVSIEAAQEALARIIEPNAKDIAQAEAKVANATIALEKAQDDLASLLEPSSQDIAQAESKVASAGIALQVAEESLARLLQPTAHDIARAESDVANARIAVEQASTTLAELKNGPGQEEIAQAQSQVDSAETTLANGQRDLTLARKQWDDNLQAAQESYDAGLAGYQNVLKKWLGIDIDEAEAGLDPDTLLGSWGVDLASLFNPSLRFDDIAKGLFAEGPPSNDPTTPWDELTVSIWTNMFPGPIAPTCEDGVVPSLGACIKKEMDDAWAAYEESSDNLATVQIQAAKALATAESLVTRYLESLAAAQELLAEAKEPADILDIEAKEKQLDLAIADLQEAEDGLASLTSGPDEADVQAPQTQVALARANLEQAEVDLAELTNGDGSREIEAAAIQVELAKATLDEARTEVAELIEGAGSLEAEASRKQVDVAIAALNKAEEDLAEVLAGADPLKVTLRESELSAARAALDSAVQRLEDATIRAPWDGVIFAVNVEVGQQVNTGLRAFEIVDPTIIRVEGIVDEIDVLFIREGARASVTMDALPGQTLAGTVSEIAVEPTTQQGVVSYPIGIELQQPPGLELPEGLSAVATVVIREDLDVLMVPIDALYGTFERPIVRVMNDGKIEERVVVLGSNDGYWAVVEDGVAEAEYVLMETERATTGGAFGAFRGLFGGGAGGFGGGRRPGGGGGPGDGGGGGR